MARIAVGGFQHETNTFAPRRADWEHFVRATGWPGLTRGAALFDVFPPTNIPLGGFIRAAGKAGHALVPLLWASATPSAHVTATAFERVMALMLGALHDALPVDAVYLDLHGAMVTERHSDGEAEILRRVRAVVGPAVPVVASLDLHANVSQAMVAAADGLVAYRTYPHVDMAATGARALALLDKRLAAGAPVHKAIRQLDYLTPLHVQCTLMQPAAGLYEAAARIESETGVWALSYTPGFGPADIRDAGPAVFAMGADAPAVEAAVGELSGLVAAAEGAFAQPTYAPEVAVRIGIQRGGVRGRPIVLADTQDNPGAGGTGDTTGLLRAVLDAKPDDAVLGLVYDPETAAAAHQAGVGAVRRFTVGGKVGGPGSQPLVAEFAVERLGDGRFTGTGPMWGGSPMDLGPMALLRQGGVRVIVASVNMQAGDQSMFRHLGIDPPTRKIIALKSSVHFRADFQPIAEDVLVVATPGANPVDYSTMNYSNHRLGLRTMPRRAS
ncbi:MAG: M81 family metallopeptidase [Alphaproteobacteria bacterium]|nr:M81 family metallopeptidase [Alphaproteobacteria bacterium]